MTMMQHTFERYNEHIHNLYDVQLGWHKTSEYLNLEPYRIDSVFVIGSFQFCAKAIDRILIAANEL